MYLLASAVTDFFSEMNWLWIVDLVAFLAVAVLIFIFFNRHHSIKLAVFISLYMLVYIAVYVLSKILEGTGLYITLQIMKYASIFIMIAIVVVYQNDFKVMFAKLARGSDKVYDINATDEALVNAAHEMVTACQNMAKNDIGALIIIVRTTVPDRILDTGTELNAIVSSGLLESIFSTKGPLHDGAVVVKGNKILSAGCFLPLSKEVDIAKDLGTRHRAAIGITEESDAVAIVVSEETGVISIAQAGKIVRYMTPERLLDEIKLAYNVSAKPKTNEKKRERKFI